MNKTRHYIQNGNLWLAKCDIDNFFDNIDHERLKKQLKPYVQDDYLLELIFMFVKMGYVGKNRQWKDRTSGVPQGAVLSPLLSNLYLTPLDQRMKDKQIAYVRYADDFIILTPDEQSARVILSETENYITNRLKLRLNPGSFVRNVQFGFKFLGLWINDSSVTLPSKKLKKLKTKIKERFNHPSFPVKYFEKIRGIRQYYGQMVPEHILYPLDDYILELWKNRLLKSDNIKTKKQIRKELHNMVFITKLYNKNVNRHRKELTDSVYELKKERKIEKAEKAVKIRRKIYERKAAENMHLHIDGYGKSIGISKGQISIKEKGKPPEKLPAYNLRQVTVSARAISVSDAFIRFCSERNIAVDFLRGSGKPYAKLFAPQSLQPELWLRQIELSRHPEANRIARKIVAAKLNNQLKLIKYFSKYAKSTDKDIAKNLDRITHGMREIKKKIRAMDTGINRDDFRQKLMGFEGAASAMYWEWFGMLIDDKVTFPGRTGKNAGDLVNQMLNYGYGILYRHIWSSVIKHGLNYETAFFHAYRKNEGALIFDLIEPFRQPIVDRTVITLINKKTKLKTKNGKLSEKTKQKLIDAVYKRLGTYDKYLKERRMMLDIMDLQTARLKARILGEVPKFVPYKTTKW